MQLKSKNVINTREDLDAIAGTAGYDEFMASLKGSMTRKQDVQVYPEGYNQPGYEGETLAPIWENVQDLNTIQRFGFNESDF
jgi:hypothetical protein